MKFRFKVVILFFATFLFSCSSINSYFDNRSMNALINDTEESDTYDNLKWAIERLQEDDEDNPKLLTLLIPVTQKKAQEMNLDEFDSSLYNQLIEVYSSIALNGVKTTDPESWSETGYEFDVTNAYLRASAIYNLASLKGDSIASELLVFLRKLDSPAIQAVILKSMLNRVDFYKQNDEIRSQAIVALSNVNVQQLDQSSVLANLLYSLEDELVSLPLINRILRKRSIYQLSQRNLAYILDVNEGVWLYLFKHPEKIVKTEIVNNSILLSSLALPDEEQFDGLVPRYSKVEKEAQRLLLQYVPGLYYFSMYNNAEISDYALGQLLSTKAYMDRYEEYAIKGKNLLVVKGDDGELFFNHHVIMNKTVYLKTAKKVQNLIFKSLSQRVEKRPTEYVDYIYSYLNVHYPKRFSAYILKQENKKYLLSSIDMLQHYYALLLSENEALSVRVKRNLFRMVKESQLTRTINYSELEMKQYVSRIYPSLVKLNGNALLKQLNKFTKNVPKQNGVTSITDYYVFALSKVNNLKRGPYLTFGAAVINRNELASTKKIMGLYIDTPLSVSAPSLKDIAFRANAHTPPENYLYLGNYISKRKVELNPKLVSIYGGIFNRGIIKEKNDDVALIAAQQGMINFSSMRAIFNQSISKRLVGVDL